MKNANCLNCLRENEIMGKITVINSRQLNIVVVKKHGFPSHTNLVRRTVVLFCIFFLLIFIMQRGNPTCDRANSATNI